MDEKKNMLLDWMRKIHQLEYAHCSQSIYYSLVEKSIGISAFVITTVIAFSYRFSNIDKEYLIPILSFVAAILTGLQTFLKPNEKAEIHRKLGLEYEKLRHTIETTLTKNDPATIDQEIKEIDTSWKSMNTVYVSNRRFNRGKKKVKSFKKYPEELGFLPTISD